MSYGDMHRDKRKSDSLFKKIGKGKTMTTKVTTETITTLKRELQQVRQASLQATRMGDFMKVARLTAAAARINKSIMDAEGELLAQS